MEDFRRSIHHWYSENKRTLPWRETNDPYLIWVSEIILQQTRIKQGLPYYERFIRQFPDVHSLAASEDDRLMKIWEGLGYYSRARHMQVAAKTIVGRFGGIFPDRYETVRSLKGIGDYTAAAIVSIAYGLPYPVVDGNIYRFLSRYFGIQEPVDISSGRDIIRKAAEYLMDKDHQGLHNQAMMEFGALCCTPRNPDCRNCPVHSGCFAFQHEMTEKLPVKSKKQIRKTRYFYYCIPEDGEHVIIEKRTGKDIWTNLHQFPLIETGYSLSDKEILSLPPLKTADTGMVTEISPGFVHILTHQEIHARFIRMKHLNIPENFQGGKLIRKAEILKFAFPVLIKKFILENYFG